MMQSRRAPFFSSLILFLLSLCLALPAIAQTRVRICAANTTSDNYQSYQEPGARIFQALDADIVLIQEFNVTNSPWASRDAFVDDVFGAEFYWSVEPGGDQIPNGVISRWPIVASGQWADSEVSNRDFAWARIDIPGDKDLWAVSLHLLTSGSGVRNSQAQSLVSYIQSNVPEGDYLVVGGDLNTDSTGESCVSTLGAVVRTSPKAEDQDGDWGTNASRSKPYDWVMPDADLRAHEVTPTYGPFSFPGGMVFDTRTFSQSELDSSFSPARTGDSGVSGMQHMAVLREFSLPDTSTDFSVSADSVDFGTVDAPGGPFSDQSISLTVRSPFTLQSVSFSGADPAEFALLSPDLGAGPLAVGSDLSLEFQWTPSENDGLSRSATANFQTSGDPSAFSISLTGRTRTPGGTGGGDPLDASNYQLAQFDGGVDLTLPANTILEPQAVVVIGRDASRAEFEGFWGSLPADAVYFSGMDLAGGNGFPVINGDETYLLRDAGGTQVDPPSGDVPSGGLSTDTSYYRESSSATAFSSRSENQATPGLFDGSAAQTGKLVISEISDASSFAYEFIELYYDAAPATSPPGVPTSPLPADGALDQPHRDLTLDWADSAEADGYEVYLWTGSSQDRPASPLQTPTASQAGVSDSVTHDTAYYWQILASGPGGESWGPVWTFQTRPSDARRLRGELLQSEPIQSSERPELDANQDDQLDAADLLLIQDQEN